MKGVLLAIDKLGAMLESRTRPAVWGALAVTVFAYAVVASVVGVARFSPDSWSYFELAKTVFGGDFYRFNTVRSHFYTEYSGSFPMGYPVVLAVAQLAFGRYPEVATFLNIVVAAATVPVVMKIADTLRLPRPIGVVLGFSLILFPFYASEIVAGRAIPLAILLFSLAALVFLRGAHFWSGLLFGLSALVRFDFLAHSVILMAAMSSFRWHGYKGLAGSIVGFAIGVSPWVAYSQGHFGELWASDNSWVALSALPAFVQDYPAHAAVTAFDDFGLWIARLAENVFPLLRSLVAASIYYPPAAALLVVLAARRRDAAGFVDVPFRAGSMLLIVSTLPYLVAGYFEGRYYALHLLCLAFLLAGRISRLADRSAAELLIRRAMAMALITSLGVGSLALLRHVHVGYSQAGAMRSELASIELLRRCQSLAPGVTYLFEPTSRVNYFKYGALTGMRTAGLPANFDAMDEGQRRQFFADMSPHVRIAAPPVAGSCPG